MPLPWSRLPPRFERLHEGFRMLGGWNLGPVATAVVSPDIQKFHAAVPEVLEHVEPAGVGKGAAHRSQVLKAPGIVGARRTLDSHAGERALEYVGAFAVGSERRHVACFSRYSRTCLAR